jgi:DNA (cytosine-5)-methyltransferase 1
MLRARFIARERRRGSEAILLGRSLAIRRPFGHNSSVAAMAPGPQALGSLSKSSAGDIHALRCTMPTHPASTAPPMSRSKQLELFGPSKIDVVPVRSTERKGVSLSAVGLFAGIGGFEIGLEASGHKTNVLCEIDPVASAVLAERFPNVRNAEDIRAMRRLPRCTSLVTGGFPCQDLSQAGCTKGINGMRSGLVREVFRLADTTKPRFILLENVPFMLQLAKGHALDVVLGELESLGYSWAYRVVDCRAFGLPQRRERVFFVASREDDPRSVLFADDAGEPPPVKRTKDMACGFYWTEGVRGLGWAVNAVPTLKGGSTVGVASPPAVLMPDGRIVTPTLEDAEALQGFRRGWTKPAEQVARSSFRWKLIGNAVAVPVARWLGKRLAKPGVVRDLAIEQLRPQAKWPRAAFNVGGGRYAVDVSAWPFHKPIVPLVEMISENAPLLSPRATAGFLRRASQGSLRFPDGFLAAVERHLRRVGKVCQR